MLKRLKDAALWLLGAAFTAFLYTGWGLAVMAVVMVPVFVIIALKTPRRLP